MNPDSTDGKIREILSKLEILDYLDNLPEGLNTSLDEAVLYQLPQGVLRLISLAQALIKDTPILLIDDEVRVCRQTSSKLSWMSCLHSESLISLGTSAV